MLHSCTKEIEEPYHTHAEIRVLLFYVLPKARPHRIKLVELFGFLRSIAIDAIIKEGGFVLAPTSSRDRLIFRGVSKPIAMACSENTESLLRKFLSSWARYVS